MSDIAIRVENLGKQYRIGKRERYKALRDVISDGFAAPFRRLRGAKNPESSSEIFWALKDVSFEVKQGEVVGIIGRNGAGKSTLLKILSRITEPSEGRVRLFGRIGSLLEVGTGFHPELTGRENVYLNGAILGMKRIDIERRFDEIVAFAEIEKFLDTPVKHYSSGMYMRLAFSVAAHLEPEILVVDEVLAVGDAAFQKKCLGKMGEVAREGRTVLFVSHNMQAMTSLCSQGILLDQGIAIFDGSIQAAVTKYLQQTTLSSMSTSRTWNDLHCAPGNDNIRVNHIGLRSIEGYPEDNYDLSTPLDLEIVYWNLVSDIPLVINMCLYSIDGSSVFEDWTADEPVWHGRQFPQGMFRTTCRIPGNLLNEGTYRIRILFFDTSTRHLFNIDDALVFTVHDVKDRPLPWYGRFIGHVHPRLMWTTELVELGIR